MCRCSFWDTFPPWCFLSFLDLWFAICHSFWKVPSHYYFKCFFSILYSSCGVRVMGMLHLLKPFHSSWMFCSLFSIFLFAFQFGKFFWHVFQTHWFLSWPQPVHLMSLSRAFFISFTVFLISSIFFWFFLKSFHLSASSSFDYCMLSTFLFPNDIKSIES